MKILVYEHITGGGLLGSPLPDALATEGDMMLRALVRDLSSIAGLEVIIPRDPRLPPVSRGVRELRLRGDETVDAVFPDLLSDVDAVWPIAPETGGVLERVCEQVLAANKTLLASSPRAVRLCSDKFRTTNHLHANGIPVVPVYRSSEPAVGQPGPWLIKPSDGVCCEGIRLFRGESQARDWLAKQADSSGCLLQPYVTAPSASLSLLCCNGEAALLSVNRQQVEIEGDSLTLRACIVDGVPGSRMRFEELAAAIAGAVPELWGYIGVDLVLAEDGARVLEINPRLTTSYAGLSEALSINPAGLVVELAQHGRLPRFELKQRHPVSTLPWAAAGAS